MESSTGVLVIGGGSTGTGIVRDLAMRGVDATLVEKGNLTRGTTGRMHGLLHSGGRYAVSDQASARDCIVENEILREIAGHCVEFTGGLFAQRPEDDEAYFEEKLEGCRECDIPVEVLSGRAARELEPYLSEEVERAIWVPDGAIDPFRLCVANVESAEAHGARIETHAEVTDLLVESGRSDGREVVGAEIRHASGTGPRDHGAAGETETIRADHVVNATGAWAGQLGDLAGVDVAVQPSKGAMTVMNVRQVDTVVNRCVPKGDADIVVPHEATAILGTTDIAVDDPETYPEHGWEVDLLIDELSELVPILQEARTLRSFWGVRPLYEPPGPETGGEAEAEGTQTGGNVGAAEAEGTQTGGGGGGGAAGTRDDGERDPTEITRDFFLLDHAERDELSGFTSIVGGKFTTYRAMAEEISDHVCEQLGVREPCRTADVPLPGSEEPARLDDAMDRYGLRSPVARRSAERLGSRTEDVLTSVDPNPVVCGCEGVTRAEIQHAIEAGAGSDLNSVRIRTRASLGNCQGGYCCLPMAHELYPRYDEPTAREALDELIAERWKGQRHALWDDQLAQAALNYAQFATTMNRDRDPAEEGPPDYAAFDAGPPEGSRSDGSHGGDGSDAVADGSGQSRDESEVDRGD